MKQRALVLSFFLALVLSANAWLPGGTVHYRQRDVALRSTETPVVDFGEEDVVADLRDVARVSGVSRRNLFRDAVVGISAVGVWFVGGGYGSFSLPPKANAYTIDKVDPDENDTYTEAQNMPGNLRVLWVGSGALTPRTGAVRSGVYKNLFKSGNEVIAVDLLKPTASDLKAAKQYASEQGFSLKFQRGDATKLTFPDESFDVVVCSLFLCQDFDPEVVVNEIRRVLKPGGRFGFFEHIEDIDKVIIGKVFGDSSVIQVQAYPEMQNILAGVVKKV
jgi:SAM-dependent methyltransferase